jgi:endonuclease YncB( thermonuclease family)
VTQKTIALLMLLALAANSGAGGHQLPGRVLRVIDGDSLVLDVRGSLFEIGLAGVDAPELNQPWGPGAAEHLRRMIAGAFVVVDAHTTRDSGMVGSIRFKGRDLGLDLIEAGLAWSLFRGDPADGPAATPHAYTRAEQAARAAGRGLWSDENPVPPWQWRRPGRP